MGVLDTLGISGAAMVWFLILGDSKLPLNVLLANLMLLRAGGILLGLRLSIVETLLSWDLNIDFNLEALALILSTT